MTDLLEEIDSMGAQNGQSSASDDVLLAGLSIRGQHLVAPRLRELREQLAEAQRARPTEFPSTGQWGELQNQVAELKREIEAKDQRFTSLLDALEKEAVDRGWCSDYNEFLRKNNIESRRDQDFEVELELNFNYTTTVSARTEDAAENLVLNDEGGVFRQEVIDHVRHCYWSDLGVTVDSVSPA